MRRLKKMSGRVKSMGPSLLLLLSVAVLFGAAFTEEGRGASRKLVAVVTGVAPKAIGPYSQGIVTDDLIFLEIGRAHV